MKDEDDPSVCRHCARPLALDIIASVSKERREWEQRYWDADLRIRHLEKRLRQMAGYTEHAAL